MGRTACCPPGQERSRVCAVRWPHGVVRTLHRMLARARALCCRGRAHALPPVSPVQYARWYPVGHELCVARLWAGGELAGSRAVARPRQPAGGRGIGARGGRRLALAEACPLRVAPFAWRAARQAWRGKQGQRRVTLVKDFLNAKSWSSFWGICRGTSKTSHGLLTISAGAKGNFSRWNGAIFTGM